MSTIKETLTTEFTMLDMDQEFAYFEHVVGCEITAAYLPAFRRHLEKRAQVATNSVPKYEAAMYGAPSNIAADHQNDEE